MKKIFLFSLVFVTLACTASDPQNSEAKKPSNIIFLIGDGMGLSAVSTGFYFGDQASVFKRFQEIGLQQTSSATHKVTDSAASGTALASGTLTYNGAVGVDTSKAVLENIAEVVAAMGWSTGVVATSTITHATPASFYAHVPQRGMEEEIAAQLIKSEIDFFAGGGRNKFNARRDSADLLPMAAEEGFTIDTTGLAVPGSLNAHKKYGFLPLAEAMPSMVEGRGDFLPEATTLAISHLSQNQKGFFLMVEGSQIDWAGHSNESEYLIGEMLDFEKVIAAALDFAEKDGNTLVVVTADHETGGLALGPKKSKPPQRIYSDYSEVELAFASGDHSATLIPVFAFGPGAEQFKGIYKNTEIYHKMRALVETK